MIRVRIKIVVGRAMEMVGVRFEQQSGPVFRLQSTLVRFSRVGR